MDINSIPLTENNLRSSDNGGKYTFEEITVPVNGKPKNRLYALLIGITDYQDIPLEKAVTFGKLRGCVSDAEKVKSYLEEYLPFEHHIHLIKNHEATKTEVVRQFQDHLAMAKKDDVVLIYFSGHGTQEHSDTFLFKEEHDNRIESIVCYYGPDTSDFLLCDKELRWLIHKLSARECHIVAIFDCCHSADNTRNALLTASLQGVEKRIPHVFPKRPWDKFIFHKDIDPQALAVEGQSRLLPEGSHIQFAACESDESAVESGGEGVFTKTILKVLKDSNGEVSYKDLFNRVRQYMRNVYEQKPRLYISGNRGDLLYHCFLNKPFQFRTNTFGEIIFNEELGWLVNRGAIDGLRKSEDAITMTDPANPSTILKAVINTIRTDSAILSIIEGTPDKEKIYQTNLDNHCTKLLRIFVAHAGTQPEDQAHLIEYIVDKGKTFLSFTTEQAQADYILRYLNEKYYITFRDDSFRPLVEPVRADDGNLLTKVTAQLLHLSRWQFVKDLENEDSDTVDINSSLAINIYEVLPDGTLNRLEPNRAQEITLPLKFQNQKWRNKIMINIRNTTNRNLYCGVLYLTTDFRSFPSFLRPEVVLLSSENQTSLRHNESPVLTVTAYDHMMWYNWPQHTEYFKFIVSTEPFEIDNLTLTSLPTPLIPGQSELVRRGGIETEGSSADINGWSTKTVALKLTNPVYNNISLERLKTMLEDDATADFAMGLYFDAVSHESFEVRYELKEEIIGNHLAIAEKGLLGNTLIELANAYARRKRKHKYDVSIQRYPTRLKIVAEGDSWFQHPLVMDTIDHLQRLYSIYCISAAGDNLRNYMSREKRNGEYFLDVLERIDPEVFLISGGGNDILGSKLRNFLADEFSTTEPEGQSPGRFLKTSILWEIETLMEVYTEIFQHLKIAKPELNVFVHGYDYPVKLNDAKKGWIGRYMIERKINREADRKAVIRLIMDTFNEKLKSVADKFDNVYYVDVRNVVRYNTEMSVDQWYDEIHPDSDGFQQVALKFMHLINQITAARRNNPGKHVKSMIVQ